FASDAFDPLRRPDWRWRRCIARADAGNGQAVLGRDDPWAREGLRLLAALRRCLGPAERREVTARFGGAGAAHGLYSRPSLRRWVAEARVVTGEAAAVTAPKVGLALETLTWFERLFFDVRDRLCHRDWVATLVLGDRAHAGIAAADIDLILKVFAF